MYSKRIQRVELPSWTVGKGYFALIDTCSSQEKWSCYDWYSCREEFTASSKNLRRMCFSSGGTATAKDVAEFMGRIERRLKLPIKSVFGRTQRNSIIWIRPALFWMNGTMKRSIFTALLRASCNYRCNKKNFQEALFSYCYLKDTKYATERFLKGYTRFRGRMNSWEGGWWDKFYWGKASEWNDDKPMPLGTEEVDKLLVKPLN